MTVDKCVQHCSDASYKYAGLQVSIAIMIFNVTQFCTQGLSLTCIESEDSLQTNIQIYLSL